MKSREERAAGPGVHRKLLWAAAASALYLIDIVVAVRNKVYGVPSTLSVGKKEPVVMAQLFGPKANRIFRTSIVAAVVLLAGLLVAIDLSPRLPLFSGANAFVRQSIPFSHEHHVGEIGIDCRFCHQFTAQSSFAGIPQTQTCMKCHRVLFNEAPMLAPVRESFATGKPITWNRVYALPDYVYFDHSIHIAGGVQCQSCHGDLGRMPWVRRVDPFFMSRCLGCHKNAGQYVRTANATFIKALTECSTCHR